MNTRKITVTIVALTLIIMATPSLFNDVNELRQDDVIEFSHGGVANGTAILGGILTWQDNAWNATWICNGGLALVAPLDWDDFIASGEHDPHNYTSWGMEITGADSYYTENAPEGEWVVTAGLDCVDDMNNSRSAGGQFGDVHDNPPTVNLTNGTTIGDVSFTLIEHGGGGGLMETILIANVYETGGTVGEVYYEWDVHDLAPDANYTIDHLIYTGPNSSISLFNVTVIGSDGDEQGVSGYFVITDYGLPANGCYMFAVMLYDADDGHLFHGDSQEFTMYPADCTGGGNNTGGNNTGGNNTGGNGPSFVCGNGDEIPFNWVNNGVEDCSDGSDEPQDFDGDGVTDNWFDCHDGTNISMDLVNDGTDDCSDGEDEGGNDYDGGSDDCDHRVQINFAQNANGTADLTFTTECVFNSDDSANMTSEWDTDGDGVLSSAEITAVQDEMDTGSICYDENSTEVPCDDGDDGLFSFDGTVMITQPGMVDDDTMIIISVDAGIVTLSSTEVINVISDATVYTHLLQYDASSEWDGGNNECHGEIDITANSPWNVSIVSFLPETDWTPTMNADGSWSVENIDSDGDGDCNSEPSEVRIFFATPEPTEPVVDTAPTCEFYYNIGGVALTADSTWSVEVESAISFEVPADGEFSLALPVGQYSVILACNDAESDAIAVSGTNGVETWEGVAQNGVIYSEGMFNITDADVNESVDITMSWSSTDFSGTFNMHFTAVESLVDAIDETEAGGLPGFTSMISITAMLGAAMVLARRKD